MTLPAGNTDTLITPSFDISTMAWLDPLAPLSVQNNGIIQVFAQDDTFALYTVIFTVTKYTGSGLSSFTSNISGEIVDTDGTNITVTLPEGTTITSITPDFSLSVGASSNPVSGSVMSFNQSILVTAQDGTTKTTYSLTVTIAEPSIPAAGSKVALTGGEWVLDVNGSYIGLWSVEDLQGMNSNLSANYVLMNDLDFTSDASYRVSSVKTTFTTGTGFTPIGSGGANVFTGSFDGNSKVISNLLINRPSDYNNGLFGYANASSTIKNTGIVNSNITGGANTAGLIGLSYSTISNSYYSGNITGLGLNVGGLVGDNRGSVYRSYTSGTVVGQAGNGTGGLIGSNSGPTISNSYSLSDVTGASDTGGFIGVNGISLVSNSYALGDISGKYAGGFMGFNFSQPVSSCIYFGTSVISSNIVGRFIGFNMNGTHTNVYVKTGLIVTNPYASSVVGTDLNTMSDLGSGIIHDWLQLKDANNNNIWEIKPGANRPTLVGVGNDNGQ
ncbi:MAG: hypothetical protein HRT66_13195 [Flavobacteriaceae bacterium]|nr:hypothetical protein [Flavobacteriaceae bacterium]